MILDDNGNDFLQECQTQPFRSDTSKCYKAEELASALLVTWRKPCYTHRKVRWQLVVVPAPK